MNTLTNANKNVWKRFMEYADNQQENRLFWVIVGILTHGTIITIATLLVIVLLGNNFVLFSIACFSMVAVLITNLAALPTKYTIPVFFFSLLTDILVMIAAVIVH